MLKKLGIPALVLASAMMVVPAKAAVRFGVTIGGPVYVPAHPYYSYAVPYYGYPYGYYYGRPYYYGYYGWHRHHHRYWHYR